MAKKVVATLKSSGAKGYSKVVKMVKSDKSNGYMFKEAIVPTELAKDFFKEK